MKKLLSIFAAVGLTATTASTVVACEKIKAKEFDPPLILEVNTEAKTQANPEKEIFFLEFVKTLGKEIDEKLQESNAARNSWWDNNTDNPTQEEISEKYDFYQEITSSEKTVVSIGDNNGKITAIKAGKVTLKYLQTSSWDGYMFSKLHLVIELTVEKQEEPKIEKLSFNF